jgi:CRP-like cAMP-binding protein
MRRSSEVGTAGLVAKIPLLSGLELEEQKLIAPLIELRHYGARETVVWEGEGGGALFHVQSGYLKATTAGADGQELLLSIMGPGEVFGELSLLDGQPRSASVVTLEASELATLDRAPFLRQLERSPQLALRLLGVLTQRLRNLSRRAENVACLDVRTRLAEALVFLADKHGRALGTTVQIPFKLSQQDLGSMVGATRESVNKLLRDWNETGVVSHVAGRLTVNNFPALRQIIVH